jgi:hypothetical protein
MQMQEMKIGDRVYHVDPRHVGVVLRYHSNDVCKVEWEETKHISYLRGRELVKVTDV